MTSAFFSLCRIFRDFCGVTFASTGTEKNGEEHGRCEDGVGIADCGNQKYGAGHMRLFAVVFANCSLRGITLKHAENARSGGAEQSHDQALARGKMTTRCGRCSILLEYLTCDVTQKIKKLSGSIKKMMDTNDVFKKTVDVYDSSVKEFMVNLTADLVKALQVYRKHLAQTCECFVDPSRYI